MTERELLRNYASIGIISIDDLIVLGKDGTVNKILKQKHPYAIWQDEKDKRWYTYITDATKLNGRKRINRTSKSKLELFLLQHYQISTSETVYTINSLWVEFEQYRSIMQKENTVKEDVKAYKKFYADDPIADRNIESIDVVDLESWLQKNIKKYKMNKHSYSKMVAPFSKLCQYAKRKKYISRNPFDDIDVRELNLADEPKKTGKEKAFMKDEQPDIFKIAMEDFMANPYPVPIGVLLTFQTGVRIGELVALKWEDIDFDAKTLRVCRYEEDVVDFSDDFKSISNYHYVIYEHDTKGEYGERVIDLTDDAIYLLELLRDYYRDNAIVTPWLFYSKNKNDKCHDRAFDIRIKKYCRQAGIKEKSLHKVRSTFISNLRDAGMSYEKIAEYVGHKSVLTTQKHYSYDLESDKRNKEIMNSLSVLSKGIQRDSKNFNKGA